MWNGSTISTGLGKIRECELSTFGSTGTHQAHSFFLELAFCFALGRGLERDPEFVERNRKETGEGWGTNLRCWQKKTVTFTNSGPCLTQISDSFSEKTPSKNANLSLFVHPGGAWTTFLNFCLCIPKWTDWTPTHREHHIIFVQKQNSEFLKVKISSGQLRSPGREPR